MQQYSNAFSSPTISAIYLPLQVDGLLLPDATVVEIFRAGKILIQADSPEWHVGTIVWRGLTLPLVSFEALNGAGLIEAEAVTRVAIINGTAEHGHLPYYAIVISDTPTMMEIYDEDIEIHEGRPRGRAEALSVAVADLTAGIPNMGWVEQHLLAYTLNS